MPPRVPPYRYSFDERDAESIAGEIETLLRSGAHLTMGDHGAALEREFSALSGRRHAVAVTSGTAALESILLAVGVAGGRVIVPTNTFGATLVPVLRAGATPVLADAADDLAIDVDDVEAKLAPDVRAVITVHIGGEISASTDRLAALCRDASVPLVEDAAHALGSSLGDRTAGSWGAAAAFSLFSTKVITSGEGGLVVTDDEAIRDAVVLLRDHAKDADGSMSVMGYNWRFSELQAIVARAQLHRLEEIVRDRNAVSRHYDERLAEVDGLRRPPRAPETKPNGYKHVLFLDRQEPQEVEAALADEHGVIAAGAVYRTPCHRQPAFARFAPGPLPNADRIAATHICLPVYTGMEPAELDRVCDAVRSAVGA